jgi:hypothetical protein
MSKTLAFTIEHQQQTEWCWAAVSKSVASFFDSPPTWTQCSIANAELGQVDCCANGSSPSCNCSWYLDRALSRVKHLRSMSTGSSGKPTIENEVDQNLPIGARIGWSGGGGHFVAIYGYDDSDATKLLIVIGDPWYGVSIVDFDVFVSDYLGSGAWTHSYFIQQ